MVYLNPCVGVYVTRVSLLKLSSLYPITSNGGAYSSDFFAVLHVDPVTLHFRFCCRYGDSIVTPYWDLSMAFK